VDPALSPIRMRGAYRPEALGALRNPRNSLDGVEKLAEWSRYHLLQVHDFLNL
jgi:hypothetical protein